jgi:hypothetical protein
MDSLWQNTDIVLMYRSVEASNDTLGAMPEDPVLQRPQVA